MSTEESIILQFLENCPDAYFTRREIARKAVKRAKFDEDPNWADGALSFLINAKRVEVDENGAIRHKKFRG